jgi:hypothetical protein
VPLLGIKVAWGFDQGLMDATIARESCLGRKIQRDDRLQPNPSGASRSPTFFRAVAGHSPNFLEIDCQPSLGHGTRLGSLPQFHFNRGLTPPPVRRRGKSLARPDLQSVSFPPRWSTFRFYGPLRDRPWLETREDNGDRARRLQMYFHGVSLGGDVKRQRQ